MTRARATRTTFLVCLLLGAGGIVFDLQSALPGPDETVKVRGPAMTAIAKGSLGRAALVVVARVNTVKGRQGIQVATLEVERVIKGRLPRGELTVIAGGPRPTNNRAAPSMPYLRDGDDRLRVFFLSRASEGIALRLDTLFEAEGMVGEEKTRTLIEHARLMGIADPDARARATLAWLLEAQKSGGTWTKVHAAREINFLARVRPSVFDVAARAAVDHAARTSRIATQRTWLCRAMKSLACLPVDLAKEVEVRPELRSLVFALEEAEDEEARLAAYLRELGRSRGAPLALVLDAAAAESTTLQIALIDGLVRRQGRDILPGLRSRYSRVGESEIHVAIVRAVGAVGGAGDVPWLTERLQNGRIRRETMFALARIRTPEAVAALQAIRKGGSNSTGAGDFIPLAEYLLGGAFVEVERAEGRTVGEARGR